MNLAQRIGIVAIGRNEGERLKRCLLSLPSDALVVYVDSGSTDGSIEWAIAQGVEIVRLDTSRPFTAARARNEGFRRLIALAPDVSYVQFIDGDCEMSARWLAGALAFMDAKPTVCAVFGRRRERAPETSIYNLICDIEWNVPVGEVRAFGGDVLIRTAAFLACEGYRADLIAGEEPELALRMRALGWTIYRIDIEMTLHDAAITQFWQWWKRQQRSGFAFAEGAALHGRSPTRHWVWETRRAVFWGLITPLLCLTVSVPSIGSGGWGLLAWLIYPAQITRLFLRSRIGLPRTRLLLAALQVIGKFPEAQGYLQFNLQRWSGTRRSLIEYKGVRR